MANDPLAQLAGMLRGQSDPIKIRAIANAVFSHPDEAMRRALMVFGSITSPFFIPGAEAAKDTIDFPQWVDALSRARMSAANNGATRILVAAPMKTGSTFITRAISEQLGLEVQGLSMLTASAYDFVQYGAGLQAYRLDELAFVSQCLAGSFVAHHHVACSPHVAGLLESYDVRPILLRRNIFDCLVSLDEFYFKNNNRPGKEDNLYFNSGMPFDWLSFSDEERMAAILDRFLQFYIDYYVSWTKCEQYELVKPLWISYEGEILSDKARLAGKILDYLKHPKLDLASVTSALSSDKKMEQVHFNKGVAGRGQSIQGANRDRVLRAADRFAKHVDWQGLID